MIDNFSDKVIKKMIALHIIKNESYSDYDFWFRNCIHVFIIVFGLLAITIPLGAWKEAIIISVVLNILRMVTGGMHASSLERCEIYSIPLISIMSYIAKYSQSSPTETIIICMFFGILLLHKVPQFGKNEEEFLLKDMNGNVDVELYRSKYINYFMIVYVLCFLGVVLSDVMGNGIGDLVACSMGISLVTVCGTMNWFKD